MHPSFQLRDRCPGAYFSFGDRLHNSIISAEKHNEDSTERGDIPVRQSYNGGLENPPSFATCFGKKEVVNHDKTNISTIEEDIASEYW